MNRIPEQIKHYAREILPSPIEILMIFDQDFRLVKRYEGEVGAIPVDPVEQVTWKDHYTLHNHSRYPLSFSINDIICEAHYNTKGAFIIRMDKVIEFIGKKSRSWDSRIIEDVVNLPSFRWFGIYKGSIFEAALDIEYLTFPDAYNSRIVELTEELDLIYLSERLG